MIRICISFFPPQERLEPVDLPRRSFRRHGAGHGAGAGRDAGRPHRDGGDGGAGGGLCSAGRETNRVAGMWRWFVSLVFGMFCLCFWNTRSVFFKCWLHVVSSVVEIYFYFWDGLAVPEKWSFPSVSGLMFFFGLQSVLYSLIWDASIFMKHLLISCFWTLWYSLQPWEDWCSKLISLIHFFQHVKKPGVICCPFPAQMTWAFSAQVGWAPVPPSSRPKLSLSPASWSYAFRTGQVGLGGFFDIFQLCWMKVTKNQELYEFATFIILWPFWRSIDIYI